MEALLTVEVEGSDDKMEEAIARIVEIARRHGVTHVKESRSAMGRRRIAAADSCKGKPL